MILGRKIVGRTAREGRSASPRSGAAAERGGAALGAAVHIRAPGEAGPRRGGGRGRRLASFAQAAQATLAALAAAAVAASAIPAQAMLGGGYDTVLQDRARLSAKLQTRGAAAWAVHTLTAPNGAVVREYVGADGVVFAVAWRGRGRPDLRQLLGDRFEAMQSDNVRIGGPRTRRPLAVLRPDFVVSTGGHPGAVWGRAYLPQELPSGFSLQSLQ